MALTFPTSCRRLRGCNADVTAVGLSVDSHFGSQFGTDVDHGEEPLVSVIDHPTDHQTNHPIDLTAGCHQFFGPGTALDLPSGIAEDIDRLAARRRFATGDIIFHAGDLGDSMFMITSGRVALRMFGTGGSSVLTQMLGPGDVLGAHTIIDPGARHPGTAVALEPTHALAVRHDDVQSLANASAECSWVLAVRLARSLSRETSQSSARIVESCWDRSDARVRNRLLQHVERFGRTDEFGVVSVAVGHEELAEFAGVARPTVSAVIQTGVRNGVLRVSRRRIEIPDLVRLREWAKWAA